MQREGRSQGESFPLFKLSPTSLSSPTTTNLSLLHSTHNSHKINKPPNLCKLRRLVTLNKRSLLSCQDAYDDAIAEGHGAYLLEQDGKHKNLPHTFSCLSFLIVLPPCTNHSNRERTQSVQNECGKPSPRQRSQHLPHLCC